MTPFSDSSPPVAAPIGAEFHRMKRRFPYGPLALLTLVVALILLAVFVVPSAGAAGGCGGG